MTKNHRKTINAIEMTVIGVFICTVCLLLFTTERSIAASAKDIRKQTVVPGTTKTPSKRAPSSTASPPSNVQKESGLPEFRKDLKVDYVQVSKTAITLGDRIEVTFAVRNLGNSQIAQVSYQIKLSVNTGAWVETLFTGNLNNLSPGSVTRESQFVTIPLSVRSYGGGFILVRIDSAEKIAEENEDNNLNGIQVTVSEGGRPDFTELAGKNWTVV